MYMYLWETLHLLDKVRGYVIIYQSIFYEWICFIFNREFLENLDNTHTDENDTNLDEELHQVSNLIGLSPKNIYRSIYIWIHWFDKNENLIIKVAKHCLYVKPIHWILGSTVESSLFVGDQCLWILWVSPTHEFTLKTFKK